MGTLSTVVISRLRSLNFVYVSRGSRDLAGHAFLFLSRIHFSFLAPPISLVFFLFRDKEQKKEGLWRRLLDTRGNRSQSHGWRKNSSLPPSSGTAPKRFRMPQLPSHLSSPGWTGRLCSPNFGNVSHSSSISELQNDHLISPGAISPLSTS